MLRTLWTAKSGMNANQDKIDAISNNIVNSSTIGYKKVEVGFKDLLSESLDKLGNPLNDKTSTVGTGTKTSTWYRDNTQGNLQSTEVETDLAIDGVGYFKVINSRGEELYTRDGSFKVDGNNNLVDKNGNKVELNYLNRYSEENIKLTNNNFSVKQNGEVYIKNGDEEIKFANISIYSAVGDNAFISVGDNLFMPNSEVEVQESNDYSIYQGFLEGSNVDIATEFSDMILTQRAFQLTSKGISTADEMWGMINNMRSR